MSLSLSDVLQCLGPRLPQQIRKPEALQRPKLPKP